MGRQGGSPDRPAGAARRRKGARKELWQVAGGLGGRTTDDVCRSRREAGAEASCKLEG